MHILLTGVSSFLGYHLAERLSRSGLRVTGTYRTPTYAIVGTRTASTCAYPLEALDLTDATSFANLPTDVDVVVHVAGVSPGLGVSNDDFLACNITGAQNLAKYALEIGVHRLIYMSSVSVHGKIKGTIVDENSPVIDPSLYGASKYLAERLFAETADRLPCVALRLPGVLGRGARRAWLPTLSTRIKQGREIVIYNPESPFNNAAHVDDIGRLVYQLVTGDWTGFLAFPIGARGMLTIREIVERFLSAVDSRPPVSIGTAPQQSFTICSEFAINRFGYKPMHMSEILDRYILESSKDLDHVSV